MNALPWQRLLRQVAVQHMAGQLGLRVGGRGPFHVSPCPCCGETERGERAGDRRGPVFVPPHGRLWKCFRCDVGGDTTSLLTARVVGQTRGLSSDDWQACREVAESLGFIQGERREVKLRPLPQAARAVEAPAVPGPRRMAPELLDAVGGGRDRVGEVLTRARLAEVAGIPGRDALRGAVAYIAAVEAERAEAALWDDVIARRCGLVEAPDAP